MSHIKDIIRRLTRVDSLDLQPSESTALLDKVRSVCFTLLARGGARTVRGVVLRGDVAKLFRFLIRALLLLKPTGCEVEQK